jgi:hypothetical protein
VVLLSGVPFSIHLSTNQREAIREGEAQGIPLLNDYYQTSLDRHENRLEEAKHVLDNLSPGITNFLIHPAQDSPELRTIAPDWRCRVADYELAGLANGVIHQLGFENETFEVVLFGSFYNGGTDLINAMEEGIHAVASKAKLVRLQAPPVIGGVVLAMEQVILDTTSVRQNLTDTTKDLLKNKDS